MKDRASPGELTAIMPQREFGELFTAVQTGRLLADSKTFVDAIPKADPASVMKRYGSESRSPDFDLEHFVAENFLLPEAEGTGLAPDPSLPVRQHIDRLWDALTRSDEQANSCTSLIELPRPYIVPGGRFREIYYWDSYFSMLGLAAAGRVQQIEDMVLNFAYLIDTVGFIPNGNRSYFCSRSQPPFFALMVELLGGLLGETATLRRFRPQLEKEYAFWMKGEAQSRCVTTVSGETLNRYWDSDPVPRAESFSEDLTVAASCDRDPADLYRDIRAACESGWDFSSRWMTGGHGMCSIRTTEVIPVDLNCLLHATERVLAAARHADGDMQQADSLRKRSDHRAEQIRSMFFCARRGMFTDLLLPDFRHADQDTLAGVFPLFCGIASQEQAHSTATRLRKDFLRAGGWQTTLAVSGHQWDAPNGWAPLQWICFQGLGNYGLQQDARAGARRWVENNLSVYRSNGRLMERYDVVNIGESVAGGEYAVQDGFGWTNGVLLRLMDELGFE